MSAITTLDNTLLSIMKHTPEKYIDQLIVLKTSNPIEFKRHINIYDPYGEEYYGGNPLHCLSMIMNTSDNIYGSDTFCNSDLAKKIFDYLIVNGCNIYHYDYYGETPLKTLKQDADNIGYYDMLVEYYRNNPINGDITICYSVYESYGNVILDIIKNTDLLRNNLHPDLFNIINNMYESNKRAVVDYLVNYCIISETGNPTINIIKPRLMDAIDKFK